MIPDGYLDSLSSGENRITDSNIARYYDKLNILTRADALFTWERISTIVAFNLGHYNALLQPYFDANPSTAEKPEQ